MTEGVTLRLVVGDGVAVWLAVALGEGEGAWLGEAVAVSVELRDDDAVCESEPVEAPLGEPVGEGDADWLGEPDTVPLGVEDCERVRDDELEAACVELGVRTCVPLIEPVEERVWLREGS